VRDYFKRNGAECPPRHNPAEFILQAIGAGSRARVGHHDWADIWSDSPEFDEVKKQITRIKDERKVAELDLNMGKGEYATPLLYQVKVVLRRMNITFWRSPNYGRPRTDSVNRRVHEIIFSCCNCIVHWTHVLATWKHRSRLTKSHFRHFPSNSLARLDHVTSGTTIRYVSTYLYSGK
jgi:hypothetical protein